MKLIEKGSHVTLEELYLLPPSTRVSIEGGESWIQRPCGLWFRPKYPWSGSTPMDFGRAGAEVEFIPSPVMSPYSTDSYAKWEGRFVTAVKVGAEDNGVGSSIIRSAFERIGVNPEAPAPPMMPGSIVYRRHNDLPVGSIISKIGSFGQPAIYLRYENQAWRDILSGRVGETPRFWARIIRVGWDGPVTIESDDVVAGPAETHRLRVAKARAWQVGMEMKRVNSWCGVLENILSQGGVSKSDLFKALTRTQQSRLPEGSLLAWSHADTWSLLIRDDSARNTAGTRRVAGNDANHTRNGAYLVYPDALSITVRMESERFATYMTANHPGSQATHDGAILRFDIGGIRTWDLTNLDPFEWVAARSRRMTTLDQRTGTFTITYLPEVTP